MFLSVVLPLKLFSIFGKRGVQADEVMRQDRREGSKKKKKPSLHLWMTCFSIFSNVEVIVCVGPGDSGCVLTTDISVVGSSLDAEPTLLGHMTGPLDDSSICAQVCV